VKQSSSSQTYSWAEDFSSSKDTLRVQTESGNHVIQTNQSTYSASTHLLILSRVRFIARFIRRVSDWMIGFIAPYTLTQLGTTDNTALSLFYTLYSSPLHTHYGSQSSLVVSWQRIYHILTVTSNHMWNLLFTV
jgi:hypothetical protein